MPDVTLSMTAPQAARASAAINGLWPIPQIDDPDWVDPEDGSGAPQVDEFTSMEWAKNRLRNWLAKTTRRWENKIAKDAADVPLDPDIAT